MALISGEANAPRLIPGLTPINHDAAQTFIDTTVENWDYNYDPSEKKWANARDLKGNMWVWIPRFTFREIEFNDDPEMKIRFSDGVNDDTSQIDGRDALNHRAFTFGSTELTGFWFFKYDAHEDEDGVAGSKPDKNIWVNINNNDIFNEALKVKDEVLNASPGQADTHMTKNVEWGAVSILAYAVGEGRPKINGESDYISGYTTNGSTNTGGSLDTSGETSTTGNPTGVFDMVGGAWNRVAAYVDNGNPALMDNGASLVEADEKYKNVYQVNPSDDDDQPNFEQNEGNMPGELIDETSQDGTSTDNGWLNWDGAPTGGSFPNSTGPFLVRGGDRGASEAGLTNFSRNSGTAGASNGFRVALVNLHIPPSLNLKNLTYPDVVFQAQGEDGVLTKIEVSINGTISEEYTTELESEKTFTVNSADLNVGDNELQIKVIDDESAETVKTLNVNKDALQTLVAGQKVIIQGEEYEIESVTPDGDSLNLTLTSQLNSGVPQSFGAEVVFEDFDVLLSLGGQPFEKMSRVSTNYKSNKAVDRFEKNADGSNITTKIIAKNYSNNQSILKKPMQLFGYGGDLV